MLPPYHHMALVRAESVKHGSALHFLGELTQHLTRSDQVSVQGPIAAPMEKRAGRYRAQLMIQSSDRKQLHTLLHQIRHTAEQKTKNRNVRWSLDVDPIDVF